MNILTPLAIFLGSALLFFLQPMVGRTLLPTFGGSSAVWSVCLAVFQMLLVGGYAYAHILVRMEARKQRRMHVVMLAVAVIWAIVIALAALPWARTGLSSGTYPAAKVLIIVLLGVGVPYLILSAGSSLLQSWAGELAGEKSRSVYRLYALSNLGSFIGLFVYPFLMETYVPLHFQWRGWSAGLAIYLALIAGIALQKKPDAPSVRSENRKSRSKYLDKSAIKAAAVQIRQLLRASAWWYILPGISTFILVSVTNHLSMDVTPVPLLWAILLGAFLLSYVAGFSRIGEGLLPLWRFFAFAALIGCALVMRSDSFQINVITGILFVFFGGIFLHGWLYSIRPEGERLTRFYLGVAVGGAVGGMSVSFLAPLVFSDVWEYPVALFVCAFAGLFFTVCSWRRRILISIFNSLLFLAGVCACITAGYMLSSKGKNIVLYERNFYGSLKVEGQNINFPGGRARVYELLNGGTIHGRQVRFDHSQEDLYDNWPTCYYGPHGGGLALSFSNKWRGPLPEKLMLSQITEFEYPQGSPMRVAAIGLGIGTMAVWGREGDDWTFYEINPLVDKVARDTRYFTYLSDSYATVRVKLGDARLLLEQERSDRAPLYDVLIVDAYTGDNVPMHLATEEAFNLYADRLTPNGVLAIHLTNWHLDLLPLCKAAARSLKMNIVGVVNDGSKSDLTDNALWVFLTRYQVKVDATGSGGDHLVDFPRVRNIRLPTDDWGGMQSLIRFDANVPVLNRNEIADGSIGRR